jgi:hypothetical protein
LVVTDKTGSGATDGEIVYHAVLPVTIYKPGFVAIGAPREAYAAPGWTALGGSPSIALAASVVSNEIVFEVLLPAGYSVEASFRICGVVT